MQLLKVIKICFHCRYLAPPSFELAYRLVDTDGNPPAPAPPPTHMHTPHTEDSFRKIWQYHSLWVEVGTHSIDTRGGVTNVTLTLHGNHK